MSAGLLTIVACVEPNEAATFEPDEPPHAVRQVTRSGSSTQRLGRCQRQSRNTRDPDMRASPSSVHRPNFFRRDILAGRR